MVDDARANRLKRAEKGVSRMRRAFSRDVMSAVEQVGGVKEYILNMMLSPDVKERIAAFKTICQVGLIEDALGEGDGKTTIVINTLAVMPTQPPREYFGDDAKTPDVLERIGGSFVATVDGPTTVLGTAAARADDVRAAAARANDSSAGPGVDDDFDPESIL